MNTTVRKRATVATVVASLVAAATLVASSPATAAPLIEGNEIADYTITLDPAERRGNSQGTSALNWGPGTIAIDKGCPEGFRRSSRTFVVTPDGLETPAAVARTNTSAALWGLQGNPISLTSVRASSWTGFTATTFPDGVNQFVITCDATLADGGFPATTDPIGGSKYFVVYIEVDRAAESWKVVEKPTGPGDEKTITQTTVAASGTTPTSTTLTATVAPNTATGTVEFKNGDNVVGTGTVSNGQAVTGISGLTANTDYTLTASYLGDATHEASSGTVALKTLADEPTIPPADTADSDISVTVPVETEAAYKGLTITTAPAASIPLANSAPRNQGEVWAASGQLGDVTVTDDRPEAERKAWNLTGALSGDKFTQVGGAGTIAASEFSWTPEKVSGEGTQGAAGKITEATKLASGDVATARNSVTTVKAGLSLNVPTGTPDGNYTAKLTLTLI